ncbi:MAG TPA: flagellar hook protein FlgE [Terracidiphilus sp.]|jgi:flagellar hook protein FlgE|nr:flagellar hook protein FlgE [Terracidiphilus sp.]
MASFYIPLTGLDADSTALNTIANNLSNMNTTGFKAQTANFADLFYQQIGTSGSGDPIQEGAGTQVASTSTDFSNGSPNSTGLSTDVALQGNGFFVVSNGSVQDLTRAGDFGIDALGNLVTSNGMKVMGYPAVNGAVNTNAPLQPINIPESGILPPQATGSFSMTATLNSAGTNQVFPASIDVYDSLGQMHTAAVTYTQTGVNAWSYSIALPASDFASGVSTPVTGTMTFDASGNLSKVNGTAVGTGAGQVSSIAVAFTGLADQAKDLNMTWNLMGSGGTPTISQVAATSAVSASTQDGFASGQYQGFTIGSDGTVTVTYSNYQKLNVGQIALGNVANLQGLKDDGNGDYSTTLASGNAIVGTSGSAGLGTMQDGALEASNVNISAEFSDLIIAQRAFEANSKSITTFDTITQETIQMIH